MVPSHPDRVPRELYQDYVWRRPARPVAQSFTRDVLGVPEAVIAAAREEATALATGGPISTVADLLVFFDGLHANPSRVVKSNEQPGSWIEPSADAPWGV